MKSFEDLFAIVADACQQEKPVAEERMTPPGVRIAPADLRPVCQALYAHPDAFFDMLSCMTAMDNGPEAGTAEVVYHLYSVPFNHQLALKVVVPRQQPEVDSVQDIWKTANWHEREAWDLLGIRFAGHPDLRRILLPADWEGHPLRKDYTKQEYYRGISLD